jgi:hypothetical protein
MNFKKSNTKILINNFLIKYKNYEKKITNNKILFFKNINNLIYIIMDYCIKVNIINIKKNYSTLMDFIHIFQEELINYLFSNINTSDFHFTDNIKLFLNKNDEDSYYKDYEINANDYGTLNTYYTNQSHNLKFSEKFKYECDKIGLYIYVMKCQNNFNNLINKLEIMINNYISLK